MVIGATPPGVSVLCHPVPRVLHTPLACTKEDGLPSIVEGLGLKRNNIEDWNTIMEDKLHSTSSGCNINISRAYIREEGKLNSLHLHSPTH